MVNTTERRTIGGPANESDGVAWIRGYKEGETQQRILEPASTWWKFPEHYSPELGYFACYSSTKEPSPEECVGCADPRERVQNRSFKYAFNAIDKDGRVRVFKLGGKIRKTLKQREQTLGKDILQKRDIVIIRTGTGLDSEYSYEWGEEYDLEDAWPDESQYNDLGEAVTQSYFDALKKLEEAPEGEPEEATEAGDPDPDPETPPTPAKKAAAPAKKATAAPAKKAAAAPAKKAAPAKTTAANRGRIGSPAAEPEPAVEDVTPDEPGPDGDTGEQVDPAEVVEARMAVLKDEWETEDVRTLLNDNGVECPPRAPRPRVMALAEQALIDGKLPPF